MGFIFYYKSNILIMFILLNRYYIIESMNVLLSITKKERKIKKNGKDRKATVY